MKLLIAGGGTGGHLFPGIAVGEEWTKRKGEVLFVGTLRGLEKTLVPSYGFPLEFIKVSSLKGGKFFSRLWTLLTLPRAFFQSWKVFKNFSPDVVLGIGGYVSGPMVLMGRFLGFKTAVLEQNSIPGLTNRFLGKWVHQVFLTFESSQKFFKAKKVCVSGNPILEKRSLLSFDRLRMSGFKPAHGELVEPLNHGYFTLLICGGSQGAHAINQIVVESSDQLKGAIPQLKIIHLTGSSDYQWVLGEYKKKNIEAEVNSFDPNIQDKYSQADLVIARAGAGTITELALWGLPSLLIPYPYAADNHQEYNAMELKNRGGAEVILQKELTKDLLVQKILSLANNESARKAMGKAAQSFSRPEAAQVVVDKLKELVPPLKVRGGQEGL